jgi:hypothetical protein
VFGTARLVTVGRTYVYRSDKGYKNQQNIELIRRRAFGKQQLIFCFVKLVPVTKTMPWRCRGKIPSTRRRTSNYSRKSSRYPFHMNPSGPKVCSGCERNEIHCMLVPDENIAPAVRPVAGHLCMYVCMYVRGVGHNLVLALRPSINYCASLLINPLIKPTLRMKCRTFSRSLNWSIQFILLITYMLNSFRVILIVRLFSTIRDGSALEFGNR